MFRLPSFWKSSHARFVERERPMLRRMVHSLYQLMNQHKKLRLAAEAEQQIAERQMLEARIGMLRKVIENERLRGELREARRQRDLLAKSVAIHLGKRIAQGDHELLLPRSRIISLHPAERVTISDHGSYTQIRYRDSRRVFCEAPLVIEEKPKLWGDVFGK